MTITKQQKREAFNNADRTEVKAIMDYIMIHYQDIVSIIENVSGKTYVRNNVYGDVIEREIQKKTEFKGYYSKRNHERRLYKKLESKQYVIGTFVLAISPDTSDELWGVYLFFISPNSKDYFFSNTLIKTLFRAHYMIDTERGKKTSYMSNPPTRYPILQKNPNQNPKQNQRMTSLQV